MTVHTGTVAQFCCVGNGVVDLIWMVDGRYSTDTYNKAQGIFFNYTSSSSDPIESTLFVPASCQTNNSSIQCGVRSSFTSKYVWSGVATLTVLPGRYVLVSYRDLTTPAGERRTGKLRTLFSALTTLDVMAISKRMIILVMATCGVQSDKKRTLHPAGPSNEKARLQRVCKRLQKPPTNP